ncbi:MAG: hypothetical protein HUK02_01895 [Bacteroidaceae bacterium]|nr:hypothetical protein [Bacteroidaceae bacterium]
MTITIPHLEAAPTVEQLRQLGAEGHICHVGWPEQFPYAPATTFRLAYTDDRLWVLFDVQEDHVRGTWLEHQEAVWQDSCVEIFLQVPGDPHYFNFENSCIGTRLAARRITRSDAQRLTPMQMDEVVCQTSLPHQPVAIDAPTRWHLLLGIPFAHLGLSEAPRELCANLYKCGDLTPVPHYVSWAPITLPQPNFHCPDFFGTILFQQ